MTLSTLGRQASALPRLSKRRIVMLVDAALCAMAIYVAIYLRLGVIPQSGGVLWLLMAVSVLLALPIFRTFGLYREIFSQAGFFSVIEIGRACAVYGLVFASVVTFVGIVGVPRTVGIIQPILLFLSISASRIFAHRWLGDVGFTQPRHDLPRVLIYGAGSSGRQMAAALSNTREMRVVGFLDDDPALQGAMINGIPIMPARDVTAIADRLHVTDVLLAMPSVSQRLRQRAIEAMREASLHVRTLPSLIDLAHGRLQLSDMRELDVQDLLGRGSVDPDPALLGRNIHGKTVLVTGAGGSIGSELCRQALAVGPARLLLFEISEFALYALHQELVEKFPEVGSGIVEVIPLLGSVLDEHRVRKVIEIWRPDTIYHAAAYKHVPIVEHNLAEGIRNNIFGTQVIAKIAGEMRVPDFVLISTDKAVRPTNVMGATKRGAELILQAMNAQHPASRFSMVRFGNVLGSSGSVVPLFRQQVRNGGPITITDLRITRYFMTIPEAAQLVIQAGAMARGGEVFVLDMGQPVRIADLARAIVELSGLKIRDDANPDGDIEIREVGLRPGEKLYEELLIGDNPAPSMHPRILMANEDCWPLAKLDAILAQILAAVEASDPGAMIGGLELLVPGYCSERGVVDWVHLEGKRSLEQGRQAAPASARASGSQTIMEFSVRSDRDSLPV